MSLSFDKIIERITDENKVYRNKFIEPFDMMATKVEEMKGILQKEPTVDTESGEIITETKMNEDPLKNITKEQRLEVLDKVLADLNSRKFQKEERLAFLNEKILKEMLRSSRFSPTSRCFMLQTIEKDMRRKMKKRKA